MPKPKPSSSPIISAKCSGRKNLALDQYGWPPVVHSIFAIPWSGWLVVAMLLFSLLIFWRRPVLGFAGIWFFLLLSPSSSIVPVVTEVSAEHRMYLPMAGLIALFIIGGWNLIRQIPSAKWIALALLLAILLPLSIRTITRNNQYQDPTALWLDNIAQYPANPRAHGDFGDSLADHATSFPAGSPESQFFYAQAAREYRKTLEMNPYFLTVIGPWPPPWKNPATSPPPRQFSPAA